MFKNRRDAAQKMQSLVTEYRGDIDIVLGIPRGGIEIGLEIAKQLNCPFKLINVRKLADAANPEVALGAVTDASSWVHQQLADRYDSTEAEAMEREARLKLAELSDRYGHQVELEDLKNKGVLLTDDGAATGATLTAAVHALREAGANPVGIAVPVASVEAISLLEDQADFTLALETPLGFIAVSDYYQDFHQVSDHEIQQMLTRLD
ncbi:MAG: phosphoribosyltransferase [Firmicutes bacterium]|nr:phosphoribosyltransferase [Bacillota bacterium]